MQYKEAEIGDTVYFWFAANGTDGAAGDGASPLFDVRLAGAAAGAAPTASGTPTLLSHANYSDGLYEIAVDSTGFAAGEYAVFCTLTISAVNPAGFCGSFRLKAAGASIHSATAAILGDHGVVSIQDDIDTLLTRIVGTLSAGSHTAQTGDSYVIVNGDHGLVSIQDDIDTLLARIVGTLDTGTHKPQSGDAYPRVGNVEGTITLLQAMQAILAYTAGKADGGGTATLHFRNQADDKNRLTMTVDADGNRSAVTPSFD